MSELLPIWNNVDLTGGSTPPPFTIPNNPNAATLKINNQSRYWLILYKAQSNIDVDRIEPFSFLIMPNQADIALKIDTTGNASSSLQPDKEFVDYSTINGAINYFKGSTQFNGSASVSIAGSVNIANSQMNVSIMGTPTFTLAAGTSVSISNPTFQISSMPAVNLAAGTTVNITGTPTMNINSMPAVTIGNATLNVKFDQTAGNNSVTIAGTPSVTITNSSVNVSVIGTPTVNISNSVLNVALSGSGNNVNIANTPSVNVSNAITISSGTINVNSANATIVNEQLTVASIYNASTTFSVPAGTTSANFNFQFIPNGTLANIHHVDLYIVSPNLYGYTVGSGSAFATFADGTTKNANANYSVTYNGFNNYSLDGNAVICNKIQFSVTCSATALAETITVYYAIDSNETSIGTIDGVITKPYDNPLKDASGSIATANTWTQAQPAVLNRRYLLVQNLSSSDMWVLLWGSSGQPTPGAPGSIYLAPNGGSFVMENTFCSTDYVFIASPTVGAKYTVRYY